MEELKNFIIANVHLDESEWDDICTHFKLISLPRNKHLLKKGGHTNSYFFVRKGALRVYFESKGNEATAWFAFENDFFADLGSLKSGLPSQYNIQALESCELCYIDSNMMEQLYEKYPKMEKFGRLTWEHAFVNVVKGFISLQTMTAKERYLMALKNPNLMQRVPLQYLASFLGMTKTSLSRLRAKIK